MRSMPMGSLSDAFFFVVFFFFFSPHLLACFHLHTLVSRAWWGSAAPSCRLNQSACVSPHPKWGIDFPKSTSRLASMSHVIVLDRLPSLFLPLSASARRSVCARPPPGAVTVLGV